MDLPRHSPYKRNSCESASSDTKSAIVYYEGVQGVFRSSSVHVLSHLANKLLRFTRKNRVCHPSRRAPAAWNNWPAIVHPVPRV